MSDKELQERTLTNDLAYPIDILQEESIAIPGFFTYETVRMFRVMKETFYWTHTAALAGKDWPLMPLLNVLILKLTETGIQQYFERIVRLLIFF